MPEPKPIQAAPPPSSTLVWPEADDEQLAFMRRVYDVHVSGALKKRRYVPDVPAKLLSEVEGGILMRSSAARLCREMMAAARQDLAESRAKSMPLALETASISAISGYRAASHQFMLWQRNFPRYFEHTKEEREAAPGGPYGEAAVGIQVKRVGNLLAAPGFSLHNDGMAMDFGTLARGENLGPSSAQAEAWRASWLFAWLAAFAGRYGFIQNRRIDEPWHWEYRPGQG